MRDRLVEAVLAGRKTATSSLLLQYEDAGERLPRVGERQTVIDSDSRPVAIIEVVDVEVIRLGDADLALARDEAEGFQSVSEWRNAHERFWNEQVRPELRNATAWRLDEETQVVVERFQIVERLPPHM
jgi:uncharacterized protein YhfF